VKRRTTGQYHHRRHRLVVVLMPGDVIGIREERCRKLFTAPLARVYQQIIAWNVEAERRSMRKATPRHSVSRGLLRKG
jgi:hypothetical protein